MTAPLLTSRVDFATPGQVIVRTGKVELGQGILAALVRAAATVLEVEPGRILIPPVSTDDAPDEGHTAGSLSIQMSGMAIERACRQARGLIAARAAAQLGASIERLTVQDGRFLLEGAPTGLDYWSWPDALHGVPLDGEAPAVGVEPQGDIPREDLRAKITGAAFLQDLVLPGLRHARVVRPPEHGAELEGLDEAAFQADHPEATIVRDGGFLAVVCEREEDAVRAAERLREAAVWRRPPFAPGLGETLDWLPALPSRSETLDISRGGANLLEWRSSSFSRPGVAHGSIGPSCGVAWAQDGRLRVWSHSQNVFALKDAVAEALGLEPAALTVIHMAGAGCYGHNGADDAAFEAALVALRCEGRPVRLQWSREEELGWAAVGAPMAVKVDAGLDEQGRIGAWRLELWSAPHARRPGVGGVNLLSATVLERPTPLAPAVDIPQAAGGGSNRNAVAAYDFADHQVIVNFVPDPPIRTSSLRALGGHANVFAIESMMDEMADLAGVDPLEFRLRHLSEPRLRRVLEAAGEMCGWGSTPVPEGRARGLAAARYKNLGGYAAVVVEVEVEDEVRPLKVWCAADVGRPVSRDGVVNQIEGGIIQSLSWALKEAAPLGPRGVEARSWKDYPILKFSETPDIEVRLVGDPADAPLGAGEVVAGPATAAVANAAARALGVRLRRLPLTRERIVAALSAD